MIQSLNTNNEWVDHVFLIEHLADIYLFLLLIK